MIYENITRAEYDALNGVNFSKLKHFKDSINKGVFELTNNKKTSAMALGSAVHVLALEPQKFESQFIIGGPVNPKTGETYGRATKAFSEWIAENNRDISEVLSAEDFMMAQEIAERARNTKSIHDSNLFEFALTWIDAKTGIECKCLVDFARKGQYIGDLKTIDADLSEDVLSREIYSRQYYQQAAFYLDGAIANNVINCDEFSFVFAQKNDAKETIEKLLGFESIEIGRAHNTKSLINYQKWLCGQTGGYTFANDCLDVPNYVRNNHFNHDYFLDR